MPNPSNWPLSIRSPIGLIPRCLMGSCAGGARPPSPSEFPRSGEGLRTTGASRGAVGAAGNLGVGEATFWGGEPLRNEVGLEPNADPRLRRLSRPLPRSMRLSSSDPATRGAVPQLMLPWRVWLRGGDAGNSPWKSSWWWSSSSSMTIPAPLLPPPAPALTKKLPDLRGDWGPVKIEVRDLAASEGESWGKAGKVGECGDTVGELESAGRDEME